MNASLSHVAYPLFHVGCRVYVVPKLETLCECETETETKTGRYFRRDILTGVFQECVTGPDEVACEY